MLILAPIPSLIEGDSKDVTLLPNRDSHEFRRLDLGAAGGFSCCLWRHRQISQEGNARF